MLTLALAFLPTTPKASKSLLFSQIQKDSLMSQTPSPRIIFIGGSNTSFGLNSQIVKDSLNLHPINTGIHINLGLEYMLDHALPFITQGDIVIVIPEYHHFFGSYAYGGEELLRTVLSVSPPDLKHLTRKQIVNILKYLPKYSWSKLNIAEYVLFTKDKIYSLDSYNGYGDTDAHWSMPRKKAGSNSTIRGEYNKAIMTKMIQFRDDITKQGAHYFVSYPGYYDEAFKKNQKCVLLVQAMYTETKMTQLGTPSDFVMSDSLIFSSPYHLNKLGVDHRTQLLIRELKPYLKLVENLGHE
jgi:hypothetical protein